MAEWTGPPPLKPIPFNRWQAQALAWHGYLWASGKRPWDAPDEFDIDTDWENLNMSNPSNPTNAKQPTAADVRNAQQVAAYGNAAPVDYFHEADPVAADFFTPAMPNQAYAKIGLFGAQGGGKTYTAASLTIGLINLLRERALREGGRPVAFLETEAGSHFVKPRFDAAGIPLVVRKTRAFANLIPAMHWTCDHGGALIVDSITHIWLEFVRTYAAELGRTTLEMSDWEFLKRKWAEAMDVFKDCPAHIIICGRAGFIYEHFTDQTGHKQLEAVGVKMKGEAEMGYEPSLLLHMTQDQDLTDPKRPQVVVLGTVMKDRADAIHGQTFANPTFGHIEPHILRLNLGGAHLPIDRDNSKALIIDPRSGRGYHEERRAVVDEIQGTMQYYVPGMSTLEKQFRLDLLQRHFGTPGWQRVEMLNLENLRRGYQTLHHELAGVGAYPNHEVPGYPRSGMPERPVFSPPRNQIIEGTGHPSNASVNKPAAPAVAPAAPAKGNDQAAEPSPILDSAGRSNPAAELETERVWDEAAAAGHVQKVSQGTADASGGPAGAPAAPSTPAAPAAAGTPAGATGEAPKRKRGRPPKSAQQTQGTPAEAGGGQTPGANPTPPQAQGDQAQNAPAPVPSEGGGVNPSPAPAPAATPGGIFDQPGTVKATESPIDAGPNTPSTPATDPAPVAQAAPSRAPGTYPATVEGHTIDPENVENPFYIDCHLAFPGGVPVESIPPTEYPAEQLALHINKQTHALDPENKMSPAGRFGKTLDDMETGDNRKLGRYMQRYAYLIGGGDVSAEEIAKHGGNKVIATAQEKTEACRYIGALRGRLKQIREIRGAWRSNTNNEIVQAWFEANGGIGGSIPAPPPTTPTPVPTSAPASPPAAEAPAPAVPAAPWWPKNPNGLRVIHQQYGECEIVNYKPDHSLWCVKVFRIGNTYWLPPAQFTPKPADPAAAPKAPTEAAPAVPPATRAAAPPENPQRVHGWGVGDRAFHRQYGWGMVTKLDGKEGAMIWTHEFDPETPVKIPFPSVPQILSKSDPSEPGESQDQAPNVPAVRTWAEFNAWLNDFCASEQIPDLKRDRGINSALARRKLLMVDRDKIPAAVLTELQTAIGERRFDWRTGEYAAA